MCGKKRVLCLFLVFFVWLSLLSLSGCSKKTGPVILPWYYASGRIICIGDSLTAGAYFGETCSAVEIEQNYPYYLSRMIEADVTNAGYSGYSASEWYLEYAAAYDWKDYDTAIIWLGTNHAPADTLAEDVLPFSDPADYAETETGYYCRLLEDIRHDNLGCMIILLNIFASKDDIEEGNRAISAIAERYNLLLLDMSDLGNAEHPELHVGSAQNPHLGKAGNLYVADRIVDFLQAFYGEDPLRCEFGIVPAANSH